MPKKILLVDDSLMMRSVIKNYLKDLDLVFIEAENGQIGVEKFKTERPVITFMDIVMPVMDGVKAAKEIKSIDSMARIIMCSSVSEEQVNNELINIGITDFVTKPFKADELIPIAKKYL